MYSRLVKDTMNIKSKSILAKLLSKENITIEHGNYTTAFFDVENRVLGLPLWKDTDKDVYDLLIGHEVSHALHTPIEGLISVMHEIPKSFINIIEDIRIEKLIQRVYPGLVGTFKRGYYKLSEKDFFEIKKKDVNTISFMNRLNVKSKLRDLIEVKFSAEEQPYVDMAMAVETWDDVVKCSMAIYEYLKEKQDEQDQTKDSDSSANGSQGSATPSSTEAESEAEQSQTDSDKTDSSSGDKSNKQNDVQDSNVENQPSSEEAGEVQGSVSEDTEEEKGEEVKSSSSGAINVDPTEDPFDTSSYDTFREREKELVDNGTNGVPPLVISGITRDQLNEMLIPYSEIKASRVDIMSKDFTYSESDNKRYGEFINETSKIVSVMAKEFEMRKSAYQYLRAKTARSGSLNVNKLHEYKFSDDIFKKVTTLANAKSHGMIMLIDKSGSMSNTIDDVIMQTLSLAMFCKKVNIPFDVYTFTSFGYRNAARDMSTVKQYSIDHGSVLLCNVLSSSLKKQDYEDAYKALYSHTLGRSGYRGRYDGMGGTPTIEVLSAMPMILSDFKSKHGVQKVIIPILTDGSPSPIAYFNKDFNNNLKPRSMNYSKDVVINVSGKYIKGNTNSLPDLMVDYLRELDAITVGYFLAQTKYDFTGKVGAATKSWNNKVFEKANKDLRTNKFVSYDNTMGYDRFFIMRTNRNSLSTEFDDFEVKEGARTAEVARAFKKYAISKKTNRIFASQFAEIVS